MLHARHLAFVHPLTGARVEAESPLPADFREALAALRRAAPAEEAAPARVRDTRRAPARAPRSGRRRR
jgi:hypothetical protein